MESPSSHCHTNENTGLMAGSRLCGPGTSLVKGDWLVVSGVVIVSTVVSIALWARSSYLSGDSYQYLRAALSFAQGQGLRDMSGGPFTLFSPFYPVLIGIGKLLFPTANIETVARLISFTGVTTALVAFYTLLRTRFGMGVSAAGALLFALSPLRVWLGLWALSDGLYVGLLMLALAIFYRSKGVALVALAGVFMGLAYLTRPEAALYAACLALVAFRSQTRRWSTTTAFLVGFVLVVTPYHAWVYHVSGKPNSNRFEVLLSQSQAFHEDKVSDILLFNRANPDGTTEPALRPELSLKQIGARYLGFGRKEVTRIAYLLGPRSLVVALLLVGTILFARTLFRRPLSSVDTWPLVLASWLLFLPIFHIEDRYLLQVLPAFLFWLILTVVGLNNLVSSRLEAGKRFAVALASLTLMVIFIASYVFRLSTQLPASDPSLLPRAAARWFETAQLLPAPTLSQGPDFAFFSNNQHLWMPKGEPEHVIAYARRNGVRYIYVSSQDVPTPLNDLLLRGAPPPEFELLHEVAASEARARLFQLN